jgi:membrane-bound lytic murein transglycosylase D
MSRIPLFSCLLPPLLLAVLLAPMASAQAESISSSDDPILIAPGYTEEERRLLASENLPTGLVLPDSADTTAANPAAASADGSTDLWQRIRNGFGMPDLQSPFTATHESWYAARPQYVQRMVDRSQRYLYHIVEEVQKRGMPTEIALLPMVESAFNPTAYSRSKAAGIWQFVPSTGKDFGLKQDWWNDNRRDVTAATDAALKYLEKLHVMFGTWELALAAYNAGEGTVQRAIERNRRQGLPTDYQSLQLPPETKNYVPKLQAVKNIVANPEQYGLNIKPIDNKPYFTQVTAPGKIDVKLAAKLAGVSVEEFTQLNPAHNRPVMANSASTQNILLPTGTEDKFAENLANYNKPLVSWQTHYAKRGERLGTIAKQYGISIAQLRDANDLSAKQRLRPNQPLLVPAKGGTVDHAAAALPDDVVEKNPPPADTKPTVIQHTVKNGDTVFSIAKRYGLTSKQLLAQNGLKNGKLRKGQVLVINSEKSRAAEPKEKVGKNKAKARGPEKISYVVKRGETLSSIAKKFNVETGDLQRWNKLSGSRLVPGRKLAIYKPDAA